MRVRLVPSVAVGMVCMSFAIPSVLTAEPVNFAYDVRPILAAKCFGCHGPDEAHRKEDLRLDTKDGILGKASTFGHIVEPGSPDNSELIARLTSDDPEEHMPPADAGPPLSEAEIAAITQWIEEGAAWSDHWSFVPPTRPAFPSIKDAAWPLNGIDHFVLARLESEGLAPAPRASKSALIRRVSLDLRGLPPSWEEVEAFVNDDSPDAYERMVDRMLASPRYGERWARMWLDLARYSDTRGYEKDLARTVWRYRDWVIDAFNRDQPYDQFTIEQLAGDLLPDATLEQRLATTFHRNTMTNDEGGTDNEEFRVYAVRDRVDTTMQVWMGLTMGCAKCHTHKYDPITIEDYYSFFAFLNQTEDADLGSEAPVMPAPTPEQVAEIASLKQQIESANHELDALALTSESRDEAVRWEERFHSIAPWVCLTPAEAVSKEGAALQILDDGSVLASGKIADTDTYVVKLNPGTVPVAMIRLEALRDDSLPKGGPGRQDEGGFVLSHITVTVLEGGDAHPMKLKSVEFSHSQAELGPKAVISDTGNNLFGWSIRPRFGEDHFADFLLAEPFQVSESAVLEIALEHKFLGQGYLLGRFRFLASPDSRSPERSAVPHDIQQLVASGERSEDQSQAIRTYVTRASGSHSASAREQLARLTKQRDAIAIPEIPVLQELPGDKRRVTKVQLRGDFLDLGEEVSAAVPEHFDDLPADAPRNRLGLAQWLVSESNPLTARVAVNRHWSQFFGRGIVETEEDFGSQGMLPTHPELLDWLAVEFMESGWSMKALCKTIVMSATYQQDSAVTPQTLERDAENRLFARGPRFRLDAELVRDNALAIAGLLSEKMYGPSVMPLQPDGIWRSTYNQTAWETSPGEDRYRRGLYTFHKRTSPYPSMLTFDAPTREWCTVRRIRTNTPLQALVTLNDPVYVEAAQAFARELLQHGGDTPQNRVAYAFRSALARAPESFETEQLVALYERRAAFFHEHSEEAKALSTEPLGPLPEGMDAAEAAAWTSVCNVILNLDEVLSKG